MPIEVGQAIGYLDLDTSGFQRGFQSALQDLKVFQDKSATLGDKTNALGGALKSVGSSMTKYVTAPLVGAGGLMVNTAAKFEYAMSGVKAISGATGEEFEALKQQALDLGGSTAFSAQEVADAMTEMAKAGWSTQQILDGMSGVLDAAAASGENLASVSTIIADTITGFGLSAADSARVADLLTQAANSGTIGVADLGESFKYIAPVAATMGYSVEEVTAALAAMSTAGIKGSQAGTSLRGMLTKMVKPTEATAIAMEQLGIELADETGKFKSLDTLLAEMRPTFQNLTDEQKTYYAAALAGQEGMSGLLALLNLSQEEYDELSNSMKNASGVAQETASVMQDNLSSKVEQLGGSIETLAIKFGTIMIPVIQDVVEWLTRVVDWFSQLDEDTQRMILIIGGIVAVVGPVLLILGQLIQSVTLVSGAVNALFGLLLAHPIGLIIAAIAGLIAYFVYLYNTNEEFRQKVQEVWSAVVEFIGSGVEAIGEFFTVVVPQKIGEMIYWFQQLPYNIGYAIGYAVGVIANWVTGLHNEAVKVGPQVISTIIQFFSDLPGNIYKFLSQALSGMGRWLFDMHAKADAECSKVVSRIVQIFADLPGKLIKVGYDIISGLGQGIINGAQWLYKQVSNIGHGIEAGFRAATKTHSPSEVMANVGEDISAGVAVGLNRGAYRIYNEIDSISNRMISSVRSLSDKLREETSADTLADEATMKALMKATEKLGISAQAVIFVANAFSNLNAIYRESLEIYTQAMEFNVLYISSINAQKKAYEELTQSIRDQIEALQDLQSVKEASSAASSIGGEDKSVASISGIHSSIKESIGKVSDMFSGFGSKSSVMNFTFNSPKALTPADAMKKTKQTMQQLSVDM